MVWCGVLASDIWGNVVWKRHSTARTTVSACSDLVASSAIRTAPTRAISAPIVSCSAMLEKIERHDWRVSLLSLKVASTSPTRSRPSDSTNTARSFSRLAGGCSVTARVSVGREREIHEAAFDILPQSASLRSIVARASAALLQNAGKRSASRRSSTVSLTPSRMRS